MTTEQFIHDHRNDDVRQLALQAGRYPGIDMPYALEQIAGWQTACRKLPSWAAIDGIVYPPHISMEQCSSEQTARYKRRKSDGRRELYIDLTGGFGVDFSFMSQGFDRAVYVERQERLCDVARKNFALLGLDNAEVVCGDGADYLHTIDHASMIYLDPARRDANGGRTYAISDCTPDVVTLLDELLDKADMIMLKLSPMLDITKTVADLEMEHKGIVSDVHIVSVDNECKELLVVMSKGNTKPLEIHCVDIDSKGGEKSGKSEEPYSLESVTEERTALRQMDPSLLPLPSSLSSLHSPQSLFLYEPNASIMKAGCFAQLCERYSVCAIGRNSHLFVSDKPIDGFPGRSFKVNAVTTMNKKELKAALSDIKKANITVRNFPMSAAELRKRLKLYDGGEVYIFGTTTDGNRHVLIIASPITHRK